MHSGGNEQVKQGFAAGPATQYTTKAELLAVYEPPKGRSMMTINGLQRETLTWSYWEGHSNTNPASFIPVVGLFVIAAGGGIQPATVGGYTLVAVCDAEGKVLSINESNSQHGPYTAP